MDFAAVFICLRLRTPYPPPLTQCIYVYTEAESKENHCVWDPMPELTITSPYVHSRVDSNTFTMGNPMPELTLTLCRVDFIPRSGTLDLPLYTHSHREVGEGGRDEPDRRLEGQQLTKLSRKNQHD
jgi:hypothetical protein